MIKYSIFFMTLLPTLSFHASEHNNEPTNETPQITTTSTPTPEITSEKCSLAHYFICCLMTSAFFTICIIGLALWQKTSNLKTSISIKTPEIPVISIPPIPSIPSNISRPI